MPLLSSSEFRVNSSVAHAGEEPTVAAHADGRFFIAWTVLTDPFEDDGESDFYTDIFGRAFSASGVALGADFVVNDELYDPQLEAQAAALPSGGYVVTYESGIEDHLINTFAATRFISAAGLPTGVERFGDSSNYNRDPDVAVQPDGSFLVVATDEFSVRAERHAADGTVLGDYVVGELFGGHAVTAVAGGLYLIAWNGKPEVPTFDGEEGEEAPFGIYGQLWTAGGSAASEPFLIAGTTAESVDLTARTLADGRVALLWDPRYQPDDEVPSETRPGDIMLAILDPDTLVSTPPLPIAPYGTESPQMTVLGNGDVVMVYTASDGSGSGIWGRILHEDGTLDAPFAVNALTTGQQLSPSVSATGDDSFVVTWSGPDGIKARTFAQDDGGPTSPLYLRAGTIDLSPSANQTVSGIAGPNSFYVDQAAKSGKDRILNFGDDDLLLTKGKLYDSNNDGLIYPGTGGLKVDGAKSSDIIRIDGLDGGLRYLGESEGLSVYATGGVRPKGAIEGRLGKDIVSGDAGDAKTSIFFVDSALGIELGDDRITRFGSRDLLVTTTALPDGNGDGIIGFGSDRLLGIGKDDLSITNIAGRAITSLEYDGRVDSGGTSYFVYSLVGSAAGVADFVP